MELISRQALNDYMRFRGETNRSLASATTGFVKKVGAGGPIKHGIVGHLRSGRRTTCSTETAKLIELALNAPPGSLFVPKMAIGSPAIRRAANAA